MSAVCSSPQDFLAADVFGLEGTAYDLAVGVASGCAYGTRSRKGDPYAFDWARAGLPANSRLIDQDALPGRAKPCTDERHADRVTSGQTPAASFLHNL